MAMTEKKKEANTRYLTQLEDIKIRVPLGYRAQIKAYAKHRGISLNQLVISLLNEDARRSDYDLNIPVGVKNAQLSGAWEVISSLNADRIDRAEKEDYYLEQGYTDAPLDLQNFYHTKIAGKRHEEAAKWFLEHAGCEDDRIKWLGKVANAAHNCEELFDVCVINDNSVNNQ